LFALDIPLYINVQCLSDRIGNRQRAHVAHHLHVRDSFASDVIAVVVVLRDTGHGNELVLYDI
jgi:hypothetical protein